MSKIVLILIFLITISCKSQMPDMVVVMSRHGAREPLSSSYDQSWKNPSYLMDVGVEQHYLLGTLLARKYSELLKDITVDEIYLQSTYASRTQMSTSAELYGLFRDHSQTHHHGKKDFNIPYANKKIVDQIIDDILKKPTDIPNKLQFLPQKLHLTIDEDLIQFTPNNCYYIRGKQDERFNDESNQEMEILLQETFLRLQSLGYDVKDMGQIKEFGDALASRYSHNKPPLQDIPYEGKTFRDSVFGFKWWNLYNLVGLEFERSLKTFPLYSRLTEWFDAKAKGTNPLKLVLLGGHESSIFPFLNLYNITNHICATENYKSQEAGQPLPYPDCQFPEVASQLIYEFYNNSGNPYIKMLYNGKPFKFCRSSQGIECNLDDFIRELPEVTSNLTKEKFDEVCTAPVNLGASQSGLDIVLMILMMIFGVIVGLTLCLLLSKKMIISHQYVKGALDESIEIIGSPISMETQTSKNHANQSADNSTAISQEFQQVIN